MRERAQEREGERGWGEKQTDRHTTAQAVRELKSKTDRQTETKRERGGGGVGGGRERERERESHTDRQRYTNREKKTERDRSADSHRKYLHRDRDKEAESAQPVITPPPDGSAGLSRWSATGRPPVHPSHSPRVHICCPPHS